MAGPIATEQQKTILLVEDEPGVQDALSMLLELEGYAVMLADDGQQGLVKLAQKRPDLVISDYMMPGMNGLEMISRLRASPEHTGIPVLLMSAALPPGVDPLVVADRFLRKPADIDRILDVVAELLEEPR